MGAELKGLAKGSGSYAGNPGIEEGIKPIERTRRPKAEGESMSQAT